MNTEAPARGITPGVNASDAAAAASAHSRINVPLNIENWRGVSDDVVTLLVWFHQYALDQKLTWDDCSEALNYDRSTLFRVLKGTYEGSWKNIGQAIQSYKKLVTERGAIQRNEFVENRISKKIFGALQYALANNSITLVTGESRMGKTTAAKAWRDANNHGRSVYVIAPAYGGTKALLRDIAAAIGVNKNASGVQIHEAILRGFNRNRILIVDEAHRLLPSERRANPVQLEIIRDIHDRTGAAVALLATQRFEDDLKKSHYMFEQLLGRIGLPVRLTRKIEEEDVLPIVRQYVSRPGAKLLAACHQIANEAGRLGVLVESLKIASRLATKKGAACAEEHVFSAFALRREMMGEVQFAAK